MKDLKGHEVLAQLSGLKETWRKQGFMLTLEQQASYDKLLQLRRARVRSFYDNDEVWKGPSIHVKPD